MTEALLRWFRREGRDLPWRRTTDPYAVWISEVMLQQTQVQTVIPFWERWMAAFPNVTVLARAPLRRVLKLWEGLGYYSRARHLHQAARIIVQEHQGAFPDDYDAILSLPGIGRYTAGAICSIAFDQPRPILDGNIIRVLTRLHGIGGDAKTGPVNRKLWELAQGWVEMAHRCRSDRPCAALNQALMELGATLCRPKQPVCEACPVQPRCVAWRTGRIAHYPQVAPRPAITQRQFVAFVPAHRERLLVWRRPAGVVNGQLWEFPNVEITDLPKPDLAKLARTCCGAKPTLLEPLCTLVHSITRYRIRIRAYRVILPRKPAGARRESRWGTVQQLEQLAFPSAHRRIFTAFQQSVAPRAALLRGSRATAGTGTQLPDAVIDVKHA